MIPKRIVYCWFGNGKMSELEEKCLKSWERCCDDWEIVRIDESVFDPTSHPYSDEAYKHGNWSFVSDIARTEYLRENGGFYLDTDVELFKSLEPLRRHKAVVCELARGFWNTAILACEDDFWPAIFHEAFDGIKRGEAIHENLNRAVYRHYNVAGEPLFEEDGIGFYGVGYIANKRQRVTERTIAKHHENNSWVDAWTGGFTPMADFIPFDVAGVDMTGWYGNEKPIGSLTFTGEASPTLDVIELGNYFLNARVVALEGDGFRFKRYGSPEGKAREIGDGLRIYTV